MFNFGVLPLVLWHSFTLGTCFTSELEALLDRAEEVTRYIVDVFQSGHNISRTGNGLEDLYSLERICDPVNPFQSVAVAEQDLDPLVVVVFGRVQHGGGVHLGTSRTRISLAFVSEFFGFV